MGSDANAVGRAQLDFNRILLLGSARVRPLLSETHDFKISRDFDQILNLSCGVTPTPTPRNTTASCQEGSHHTLRHGHYFGLWCRKCSDGLPSWGPLQHWVGGCNVSRAVLEERTHSVLRQTQWVLQETRWVHFSTQIRKRLKGAHWVPFRNSVSPKKLTEFDVWNRTLQNRTRPVSDIWLG